MANTVKAGQDHDWAKLGTSIVGIAENGIGALSKIFGG
nr:beta-class phenol-soluble modulin [Staphylococcus capitis]